jgi:hypothetical protein
LLADRLRLNLYWSRFRVGFYLGYSFSLRFRLDISFSRMLLGHFMLRFFWRFLQGRIRRRLPLHHLGCGREYLDPTWKVVLALIPDVIRETGCDPVLAIKYDLIGNIDNEHAPVWGRHIHAAYNAFAEAPHRKRRMEVDADSITNCNVGCHHLSHSQTLQPVAAGAERPTSQLGCD